MVDEFYREEDPELEAARRAAIHKVRANKHGINPSTNWPGWRPSAARKLTDSPVLASNGMRWEADERGDHRVVGVDGRGGDWANYAGPAVSPCGRFVAFTAYYEGTVPIECVVEINPVPVSKEAKPFPDEAIDH